MSDWTQSPPPWAPTHVSTLSLAAIGGIVRGVAGSFSPSITTAYISANLGIYVPFSLPYAYNVQRIWWANGSAAAGNTDVGLYTLDGKRIVSAGPTAESGSSALQYVVVSLDLILSPGRYYLAYSHGDTTANRVCTCAMTVAAMRASGCYEQASVGTLPASATFAAVATANMVPVCGISRTSSGF